MMHESKGQHIGKAPSLHLFHSYLSHELFAVQKKLNYAQVNIGN